MSVPSKKIVAFGATGYITKDGNTCRKVQMTFDDLGNHTGWSVSGTNCDHFGDVPMPPGGPGMPDSTDRFRVLEVRSINEVIVRSDYYGGCFRAYRTHWRTVNGVDQKIWKALGIECPTTTTYPGTGKPVLNPSPTPPGDTWEAPKHGRPENTWFTSLIESIDTNTVLATGAFIATLIGFYIYLRRNGK